MNNFNLKTAQKPVNKENKVEKKVIMLNISQFELTKILYSSGILSECDLTPSAKLFLWALCSHYNPGNKTMFPSQQTVAKKLGISEKSAQRAVKELKTHNLIDYETKRVNHYVFGEKFFELVKMSGMIGQNVLSEGGQNVRLTNKHEKKEEHAFSFSSKKAGNGQQKRYTGQKEEAKRRTPNVEETRKILEEREKISAMSFNPQDFNEKEALDWLRSIPKFWLSKSKVAEILVQKFKFSEFQEILDRKKISAHSDFCSDLDEDLKLSADNLGEKMPEL